MHTKSEAPVAEQIETSEKQVSNLHVDTEEHGHAVKGDDSDGVIQWTGKHAIASLSLAGLYVGRSWPSNQQTSDIRKTTQADSMDTGAQIPLYFVGGSLTFIINDIGSPEKSSWLPVANTLAIASIAPFVGYLQDIFGRRNMSLLGGVAIMVGIVLVGTSHDFGQAVTGMSIAGAGGAVGELTALAGYDPSQCLTFSVLTGDVSEPLNLFLSRNEVST